MSSTATFLTFVLLSAPSLKGQEPASIDGITFANHPSTLYVPVREVSKALDMPLGITKEGRIQLAGIKLAAKGRTLRKGQRLIPLRALKRWKADLSWNPAKQEAKVTRMGKSVSVRLGAKHVVIEKTTQRLIAKQGKRTVLDTRVSTGRAGYRTPNGTFKVGLKRRFHRSTLYDDAPMPFSVQVVGDIFIHGYTSVPKAPASHGCIRLPLNGTAEYFFDWVEPGTAVNVKGKWGKK